jgi:Cu(I)/Ag(I) efflux system membrane fusion protein
VFKGKIAYIDPVVDEKTRTVRVRVNVPNRSGELKPGMFVTAMNWMEGQSPEAPLVIPASAPLITGKRAVVYVETPGKPGTYEGREILIGPRAGDYYIVKQGLFEGERVVTKGGFKIDSAIQIMARPSMMNPGGSAAGRGAGHDHGDHGPGRTIHGRQGAFKVPLSMAANLHQLSTSFDQLRGGVENRDLDESRSRYGEFHDALRALDPSPLTGQAALLWRELSMVLGNDAYLGNEAETLEEADRLFGVLEGHYRLLRNLFPIEQEPGTGAVEKTFDVPDEFRKQLGLTLDPYLALQTALAGDDFEAAKKAGESFGRSLKGVDMHLLEHEAHLLWMEALESINEGVPKAVEAKDISELRSAFEPISLGLIRAVESLGVQIEGPLFELSCPMAFENKGAAWLQRDEDIRNPYFGEVMFKCGEVKRRIKGVSGK